MLLFSSFTNTILCSHKVLTWGFQTETTPSLSHEEAWVSLSWLIFGSPPPSLLSSRFQRNSTSRLASFLLCCNHPSRILSDIHPAVVLALLCFHPDHFHDLFSFAKNMILPFLTFLFYLVSYNLVSFFSFLNFSKISLWLATLNFLNPNQWKILTLWKANFCLRYSHETSLCTVTNGFLIARSSGLFSVFNPLRFPRRLGQSATWAIFCCVYT